MLLRVAPSVATHCERSLYRAATAPGGRGDAPAELVARFDVGRRPLSATPRRRAGRLVLWIALFGLLAGTAGAQTITEFSVGISACVPRGHHVRPRWQSISGLRNNSATALAGSPSPASSPSSASAQERACYRHTDPGRVAHRRVERAIDPGRVAGPVAAAQRSAASCADHLRVRSRA